MQGRKISLFSVGWVFLGILLGWLFPVSTVQAAGRFLFSEQTYRVARTTVLFQRLCSELLPTTPLGRHYLDLGFTHATPLMRLLWYDQAMTRQTWHVIDLYTPAVEALLDGQGDAVTVSQEMVDELQSFLSGMQSRAEDDLKRIIAEERAKVPWQELVGLTAGQAWVILQGFAPASQ